MKKRLLTSLLSVILTAPLLVAAGSASAAELGAGNLGSDAADVAPQSNDELTTLDELSGTRIGVLTGVVLDEVIATDLRATPVYYEDPSAALEDVSLGRLSGYITDLSAARVLAATNPEVGIIELPAAMFSLPIGAFSGDQAVIDSFNEFLAGASQDGTLAEMEQRWLSTETDLDLPPIAIPSGASESAGTLTVATTATAPPYAFSGAGGDLNGFSIELARRYASWAGMSLQLVAMDFSGLIPYVVSGKAQLGLEGVSITPEREQLVNFSDPITTDQAAVLVKGAGQPTNGSETVSQAAALTWEDFIGKRFAVKEGSIYDAIATDDFAAAEVLRFDDYPSIYEAVLTGKADVGMRSFLPSRMLQYEDAYADLAVLELTDERWALPFGAISMDPTLIAELNAFIAELKASPTYDEMVDRWFVNFQPPVIPAMPEIPLTGENGTFQVAVSSDYLPLSFLGANGQHVGFDIELATRFAAYQGKDIEFNDMAFAALLPYVISEKADFGISDIVFTEERAEQVLFSDIYYTDSSALLFRRDSVSDEALAAIDTAAQAGGSSRSPAQGNATGTNAGVALEGNWLQRGIQRNLIQDGRWKLVVNGLGVTLLIAISAQTFGTVLGAGLCYVLLRSSRLANGLGRAYCGLIHGTPIVVLLMLFYYVVFGSSAISNVLIAIVAFTLVTAADVAQTLKTGIESVDPVEIEAVRSLGFSAFRTFLTVTLPQAVRQAMPGYLTGFVELVKATAIVGYIAIMDLTRAGDLIRSRTYDAYFPLLLVALIYFLVTSSLVFLFKRLLGRLRISATA